MYRILIAVVLIAGCARSQIRNANEAMRPSVMPSLTDDLEWSGFIEGLEAQIKHLKTKPAGDMGFGPRVVSREAYIKAMEYLLAEAKADASGEKFRVALKSNFDALEVYGGDHWGEVFMTSYFEPVIEGSLKADAKYTQPLFERPKDMVDVDLDSFVEARPSLSLLDQAPMEQRTLGNILRGRLMASADPERSPKIVAYPNRAGIYASEIKTISKPLVYVDPIDAFILEIQGSGVVKLKNGKEIKVGYAAQNGHPYVAVGKFLFDIIPREKMTMFAIENHLRSLPPEDAKRFMEHNPSYVFFKTLTTNGITYFGNGLHAGRTIATDQFFFPKGTLAFLEFEKPQFADEKAVEASGWSPAARFVFDQDTGGAIRGPGRVDLYSGRGAAAKQVASVMKNKGRLVYFVPKAEFLPALAQAAQP
jgi:membrane-bound lytic murein transglycosylase A